MALLQVAARSMGNLAKLAPHCPYEVLLAKHLLALMKRLSQEKERLTLQEFVSFKELEQPFKMALDTLERGKTLTWVELDGAIRKYFMKQLQEPSFLEKGALLYDQAKLCKEFFNAFLAEIEREGNMGRKEVNDFKKDIDAWEPFLNHIKARVLLSPDLQKKIQCVAKRYIETVGFLVFSEIERVKEFQSQLTLLFERGRFTPLVFLNKGAFKTAYAVHDATLNRIYCVAIDRIKCLDLNFNPFEREASLRLSGQPGIICTHDVREVVIRGPVDFTTPCELLQGYHQELMDGELYPLQKQLYNGQVPTELYSGKSPPYSIEPEVLMKITLDILTSLVTLEANALVHKDIHSANYLYQINEEGVITVKLADFGFSQPLGAKSLPFEFVLFDKAPEFVLDNLLNSHKMDVYSVGFLLYKIYFQDLPGMKLGDSRKRECSAFELVLNAKSVDGNIRAKKNPKWFPNRPLQEAYKGTILAVIWHMLQFDPIKRYSGEQALQAAKRVYENQLPSAAASSSLS